MKFLFGILLVLATSLAHAERDYSEYIDKCDVGLDPLVKEVAQLLRKKDLQALYEAEDLLAGSEREIEIKAKFFPRWLNALYDLGAYEELIDLAEPVLERRPWLYQSRLIVVDAYLKLGDLVSAEDQLSRVSFTMPNSNRPNLSAISRQIQLMIARGNGLRAAQILLNFPSIHYSAPLQAAVDSVLQGFDQGMDWVTSSNVPLLLLRADNQLRVQKDLRGANASVERALEIAPQNRQAQLIKLKIMVFLGRRSALAYADELLATDPGWGEVLEEKAFMLVERFRFAEGLESAGQALANGYSSASLFKIQARANLGLEDYPAALISIEKALARMKDDSSRETAPLQTLYVEILIKNDRLDQAEDIMGRSDRIRHYRVLRAQLELRRGHYIEALNWVKDKPASQAMQWLRAHIFFSWGDYRTTQDILNAILADRNASKNSKMWAMLALIKTVSMDNQLKQTPAVQAALDRLQPEQLAQLQQRATNLTWNENINAP